MKLTIDSKYSYFLQFSIIIIILLVIFAIVPNSFAISITGAVLSGILLLINKSSKNFLYNLPSRFFYTAVIIWLTLVITAVCLQSYLRYFSPGYDLAWFVQAVTNVTMGENLRVTIEREINHLVQHWEPILYTAVPFTYIFNASIALVFWQGLAYAGGTLAVWKISNVLFKDHSLESLKYLTTILYLLSWLNVNPLMFDIHPPVFGTLLIIPWIFYFIITNKSRIYVIILSLILMQCGEIYFAISPIFIIYCLLKKKVTIPKLILATIIYGSGFLLIATYQKYFGPFITGDPFPFASRYKDIGGDGMGILKTFLTDPLLVLSKFITVNKVKTILKIFLYCGPFALVAIFYKKYRLIAVCLSLGCVPYFIQAGLAPRMETNEHYIASIGTIWWLLTVIGIYFLLYEIKPTSNWLKLRDYIFTPAKVVPFFVILFFLNTSEWRKSLLYPFRAIVDRDNVSTEVRKYLTQIPIEKGVVFIGTEWLCPLAADSRKWLLCEGFPEKVISKMPLDVVIASPESLQNIYHNLNPSFSNNIPGQVLKALIENKPENVGWRKIGAFSQNIEPKFSNEKNIINYAIWEKL